MKLSRKIFLFIIIFSLGFYLLRTEGQYIYYNIGILVSDLGGLVYLYSTIGIIFAILAAFVILSEVERWNSLVDAIKGEAGELNELWLWSQYLSDDLKKEFKKNIKEYLENLNEEVWQNNKIKEKNLKIEKVLNSLHNDIYKTISEAPSLMPEIFSTFSHLIKYRERRIHFTSFHLPKILKNTLIFSDILLVLLSLLIGVHNSWLNYIFIISIASLCYVIYLLIDDLDNPTRPGIWQVTIKDFSELLNKISN